MVPFGLAEAVVFLGTRHFRWRVWAALAFGATPLLMSWPLLMKLRSFYGAHLWYHYVFASLPSTYGAFFLTDSAFGAAVFVLAVAGVMGSHLLLRPGALAEGKVRDTDVAEGTLLLALVSLPIIALVGVTIMHAGMRDAYALSAVIGIAMAVGYALSLARPQVIALFALFIFTSVGLRELYFWRANRSLQLASPAVALEEFVQKSGYAGLPVVVSDGTAYTPIAHYAAPAFFNQLFYLMDPEKELHYRGMDTLDKDFALLPDYMPLQVRDFSEFTAAHSVFLVYGEEPGDGNNWLPQHLSRVASVRSIVVEPSRRLYLVTIQEASSR